jgi:hypothetical protein
VIFLCQTVAWQVPDFTTGVRSLANCAANRQGCKGEAIMSHRQARRHAISRRRFIAGSAATSALTFPGVVRGQAKAIKVGLIHPVTGFVAYSGQQSRIGAAMAIEDVNKAGGIKTVGAPRWRHFWAIANPWSRWASSPPAKRQLGLIQVGEGWRIFPNLTVRENLELGSFRPGRSGRNLERVGEIFPRLAQR